MPEPRTVLDTIVQSSTVDLFHSYGLAVAPHPPRNQGAARTPYHELTAMIAFRGKRFTGVLTIGVPNPVFAVIPQVPNRPFGGRDWIREMCNQLFGRLKSRLTQLGTQLQANLPSLITREALEQLQPRSVLFSVYGFRTLRGEIVVTLAGDIDPGVLVYDGTFRLAGEGDIILL